jgi:hypothetical protein
MERLIALASLVVLTLPSILFLAGRMELDRVKEIMLVATAVWFLSAVAWMWDSGAEADGNGKEPAKR